MSVLFKSEIGDHQLSSDFFSSISPQSLVKAKIVSKYFVAWAKIMMSVGSDGRIAYIDLFSGPGRYEDDSASTPLLVLEEAIANDAIRNGLVSIFNDKDESNSQALKNEIAQLPGIETLKFAPQVDKTEVDAAMAQQLHEMRLIPTLFFIDPWGYKGLSLDLIGSVLKDWGCDCIFFFNYNRLNMGLGNDQVAIHVENLFTKSIANSLREKVQGLSPSDRENTIVEALKEALRSRLGEFVVTFCFINNEGNRTSHYLVFVTKNFRGYEIMKEVMAKESTRSPQGVPTFTFNPNDLKNPPLIDIERPLDEMEDMLCAEYSGQTLTMKVIYECHSNGRRYLKRNYKEALRILEANGRIQADPPASKRKKNTFADHVVVTFP